MRKLIEKEKEMCSDETENADEDLNWGTLPQTPSWPSDLDLELNLPPQAYLTNCLGWLPEYGGGGWGEGDRAVLGVEQMWNLGFQLHLGLVLVPLLHIIQLMPVSVQQTHQGNRHVQRAASFCCPLSFDACCC